MKKLRLKLAEWLLPKGFEVRSIVTVILNSDEEHKLEESLYQPATPGELWRETRKALVGDDE